MPRKRRTPQDAAASTSTGKGASVKTGLPEVSQLEEQLVELHVETAPQSPAPPRVPPIPCPIQPAPALPSRPVVAPAPAPATLAASPHVLVAPVAAIPASSKSLRFPLRPGLGNAGRKCSVKANHFLVKLPDKDLHQYDVTISPEVQSRGVNRAIIDELVKLYQASHLGGRLPAYDGRKSLYTAGALPCDSVEFNINLVDEHETRGRQRTFKVKIKHAATVSMSHLKSFLAGKQADVPQEALQAFDIVLREFPTRRYAPVGRSFFSHFLGRQPLGGGLESWRGFYQSVRPAQMGLSLNIDLSATAFIQPLPVVELVSKTLGKQLDRVFPDSDRTRVKKLLRGLKVQVTHRGTAKRRYRISGLTSQPTRDLTFPVDEDGTVQTVMKYFEEKYGYTIQYPFLPCLEVGSQQRLNYLPMEVCKIVEGQRYPKRLAEGQVSELRNVTCQRPPARESYILKCVQENAYHKDSFAREFGISISENISLVEARVLPPPKLKYHDSGRERDCIPRIGKWNMMNKKMVNGAAVKYWTCLNFARLNFDVVSAFCGSLTRMCQTSGMAFNDQPVLPVFNSRPEHVESVLPQLYGRVKQQTSGQHLQLLIVILPDNNGPLYGDVKRICETSIGIVSQCCLQKNVLKMNSQYFANVALKINAKVGGRNTVLDDAISRRIPLVSDKPTIIFGADVTHPQPGEDSSPSIAAVVASQDWPEITKYAGVVRAQSHRKEMIEHLYESWVDPSKGPVHGGMIRELLLCFYTSTKQKPSRLIFYRDGVSEGQFSQVLQYELDAIHKACASLEANYRPLVTFVVVQKRHHTRLFPTNQNDSSLKDKSGNILPGTVVDSKICHPTEFDFYLCSHAGIQGTSRPAHYHVLWDENKFTADLLQTFTNNLCYTYARSTSSVSIVPPAYYAHLAAFRARFYMPNDSSDSGSVTTGSGSRAAGHAIRDLPPVMDNLKPFMFYC